MSRLVEYPLEGGGSVIVEVADDAAGLVPVGAGELLARAEETFQQALSGLSDAASAIVAELRALSPDAISVEFGVKLGGKFGAIIASASGEASIKVTVRWSADAVGR